MNTLCGQSCRGLIRHWNSGRPWSTVAMWRHRGHPAQTISVLGTPPFAVFHETISHWSHAGAVAATKIWPAPLDLQRRSSPFSAHRRLLRSWSIVEAMTMWLAPLPPVQIMSVRGTLSHCWALGMPPSAGSSMSIPNILPQCCRWRICVVACTPRPLVQIYMFVIRAQTRRHNCAVVQMASMATQGGAAL